MNILVVVDMQNDFIDCALGTPEAVAAVPSVIQEVQSKDYDMIFATMDTHGEDYLDHLEGKYLPVKHCLKGTEGWKIHPEIEAELQKRDAVIVEKGTFGSITLAQKIASLKPEKITLCGVCTDICVVSNALLLRAYLPDTPIQVKSLACAGTTPENHQSSLDTMRSCQIDVL